jgi:SAM-dependent methyltransferase
LAAVSPAGEPDPFLDSFTGLVAARTLTTAVELGVFEALHEAPATPAELASRLELDPLGTETLLTALRVMGYVEIDGDRARNSAVAEEKLVRSAPESIATFAGGQAELHWEVLTRLPEAIRTGRPYAMHEERRDDVRHWRAYMRGLYEISRPEHDDNAAAIPVEEPRTLVDVAGGHGGFSMAMCRRHPELRATVVDLPPSVEAGREVVEEEGFSDRISFRAGDVFEIGLGDDADVVAIFNLIHHLPEERNRELVRMARAALRSGGALAIGDSAKPEPGEPIAEHGAISSVLFYAWSHSRNFSVREIRAWMEEAGFADVEVVRNERSPWRVMVVGR